MSLQLPVGTTRSQRERRRDDYASPERRQHVYVENKAALISGEANEPKNRDEAATLEKMKILKEKYGDGASGHG
jgi:hypothetical protein